MRKIVLLLAALLVCGAGVRAISIASSHRITPDGDAAVHVRLSQTALSDHLLLAPGASTGYYGNKPTHHPGPVMFYAGQPFIDSMGSRLGSWVYMATVNCGCILVAGWAGLRSAGVRGALAMVLAGAVVVTTAIPNQFLVMHITYMGALPLFAGLAVAWAVAKGDWMLLPVLAALASAATQTELEYLLPFVPIVVTAPLYGVWRDRAEHRSLRPAARWTALTAALVLVLWAPSLFEQFFRGHNLSMLASSHVPTRGLGGLGLVWGTLLRLPHLQSGALTYQDLHPFGLGSVVLAALIAALVFWQRRRASASGPLLAIVLAAFVGAGLGGFALPLADGNPQHLIWVTCVAVFAWTALALFLAPGVLDLLARLVRSQERARLVAGVVVLWFLTVTVLQFAPPTNAAILRPSVAINQLVPELAAALPPHEPIVVTSIGVNSWIVGPGLAPRLEELGRPIRFGVGPTPDTKVQLVVTRGGHLYGLHGAPLATSHTRATVPGLQAALRRLGAWVRAHGPLVLSSTAREALPQLVDGLAPTLCVRDLLAHPEKLFALGGDSLVASVFAMGLVLSPQLPPALAPVPLEWSDGRDFVVWRLDRPRIGTGGPGLLLSKPGCA